MEDSNSSNYNNSQHVFIDTHQDDYIVPIGNIRNEENLMDDLAEQDKTSFISGYDSPITMSIYGSNNNSYHGSDYEDDIDISNNKMSPTKTLSLEDISNMTEKNLLHVIQQSKHKKFKKLKLCDIERSVEKYYSSFQSKYVSELDILTTFMKGQKNLYIQCKHYTQWKLNCLMIPSFLLTCGISIINPFLGCENEAHLAVLSGLNAIVALLLSIINYLKLESSTQVFFQMANHYDKYETSLEMTNSKLLFMDNENDKKTLVLEKINSIEENIMEVKDNYQELLPEAIKSLFPIISHINIFSFFKRMQNHRQTILSKLKDVKNEIRYIEYKWDMQEQSNSYDREKARYDYLMKIKDDLKQEINEFKCIYWHLDEIFTSEIRKAEKNLNYFGIWFLCFWKYANNKVETNHSNPIIHKYFHFIFDDH